AYYREDTPGRLKEAGLRDYLVLLSICHTCRYKGVSFLRFLLSRKQDVDAFCQKQRPRQRRAAIEVYPKGIVRTAVAGARKGITPFRRRARCACKLGALLAITNRLGIEFLGC